MEFKYLEAMQFLVARIEISRGFLRCLKQFISNEEMEIISNFMGFEDYDSFLESMRIKKSHSPQFIFLLLKAIKNIFDKRNQRTVKRDGKEFLKFLTVLVIERPRLIDTPLRIPFLMVRIENYLTDKELNNLVLDLHFNTFEELKKYYYDISDFFERIRIDILILSEMSIILARRESEARSFLRG